ncbi:PH domain-containing protein [Rubripirellula sp.]|nr:PH domain-containing protein [Rubripirellula sp.]MDB4621304.1 PH domain-containing protein [Rubripirellula sp.]
MNNESEREEAQEDAPDGQKTTPPPTQNAADKFREQIQNTQETVDDYEPEEELWNGGYSAKAMVGTWLLIAILSVATLILPHLVPIFGFLTFLPSLGVIFLVWVVGAVVYGWRRFGVHYELTSQRFIHQTGILTRDTDRIEVIDIDDVSFTQGPVQRMFGVGRITVTSSDRSHPLLHMIGIADVKSVAGLIDDVRRKERRRRSLHIEAI